MTKMETRNLSFSWRKQINSHLGWKTRFLNTAEHKLLARILINDLTAQQIVA